MTPQSILGKIKDLGRAGPKEGQGGLVSQSTCLTPKSKRLLSRKQRLLCLISNFAPPPPDERLAPLSRLLCCRLWMLVIRINTCHCVLFSCWNFNKWAYFGEIQYNLAFCVGQSYDGVAAMASEQSGVTSIV